MWGRESFIYLPTRAPDVFHSQFACCGRCHSPRIESRILLPLAVASSCFSHVILRFLGLAVRAMERRGRCVLVPCLADNLPRTGWLCRESRNIALEEVPRSGVHARCEVKSPNQPTFSPTI